MFQPFRSCSAPERAGRCRKRVENLAVLGQHLFEMRPDLGGFGVSVHERQHELECPRIASDGLVGETAQHDFQHWYAARAAVFGHLDPSMEDVVQHRPNTFGTFGAPFGVATLPRLELRCLRRSSIADFVPG